MDKTPLGIQPLELIYCLGFQEGNSDKVYLLTRCGSDYYVVWGRRQKGRLNKKKIEYTSGINTVYCKEDSGYCRILPDDIPDLECRLEECLSA